MMTERDIEIDEIHANNAISELDSETKVAIVNEYTDAWRNAGFGLEYGLTHEDFQDRIGPMDETTLESALADLTGVVLRETDEGYKLRYLGWVIVSKLLRSPIADPTDADPFRFSSRCHLCGAGELEAHYENVWLWIDCPACDRHVTTIKRPPVNVEERSFEEFLDSADRSHRRRTQTIADGICPHCFCDMPVSVEYFEWGEKSFTRPTFQCLDCDREYRSPLGWAVLDHPAVADFYDRHGIDIDDRYAWELGPLVHNRYETVRSEDPWRFEVRFPWQDDELAFVVDEELDVVEVADHLPLHAP